jgi:hypothetical protein
MTVRMLILRVEWLGVLSEDITSEIKGASAVPCASFQATQPGRVAGTCRHSPRRVPSTRIQVDLNRALSCTLSVPMAAPLNGQKPRNLLCGCQHYPARS